MTNFTPKTCCIKTDPPTLVFFYLMNDTGKLHRRSIPIRDMKQQTRVEDVIKNLSSTHHGKYLKKIPQLQLKRLLEKLHEKIHSPSQEKQSLQKTEKENLNKLSDTELNKVKEQMSEQFEENRIRPGDDNWKYDIEVDFDLDAGNKIESGWDSEESDIEF